MDFDKVLKYMGYCFIIKTSYDIVIYSYPKIRNIYKKLPIVQKIKNNIKEEHIENIKKELNKDILGNKLYLEIPKENMTEDEINNIIDKLKKLQRFDIDKGMFSGTIYTNNNNLDKFLNKHFLNFFRSNPLHIDTFPAIRKMESEIISMMINLFNGDKQVRGCFTSGGTESILLACKAYRDLGISKGIKEPEIIISSTAHASYKKAATYFKIKLIEIPCKNDGLFDLNALEKNININTVLVVGSAPSYNLGIIDQIELMSKIVSSKNIGLHLDACLGAFLLNFKEEILDFRIPGVTSISADIHKYGGSPKGASVILYKNKELMKHQYYIDDKWTGGIYATHTFKASRNGNIVALSWITLLYMGLNGYLKNYNHINEIKNYFIEKINEIDDIFIYGKPELGIVAIGSNKFDINILTNKLKDKKWNLNMIQKPKGFHLCITVCHNKKIIDKLINDIKIIIKDINVDDKINNSIYVYGTNQEINDNELVKEIVIEYLHNINILPNEQE